MNLSDYFESVVEACGDKTALVYKDKETSYRQLYQRVCMLSSTLLNYGLEKGDRIAVLSPNSDKYIEIALAVSRAGLVLENYNFRSGEKTLQLLVEGSRPKILFVHSVKFLSKSTEDFISTFSRIIFLYEEDTSDSVAYEELFSDATEGCKMNSVNDDDLAAILYTSGTTSTPKAVLLSNKNIMSQTIINGLETGWKQEDVYCQGQPLFHVAAFGGYCTLILGGTLVLIDNFELNELFRVIDKYSVTRIGLTPQLIQLFSRLEGAQKESIKSLKTIIYSGSSMSHEILVEGHENLCCEFYGLYGMTETASIVCILHADEHRDIINSPDRRLIPVGRTTIGTQIKITEEYGDGVGEFVVKNDGVMIGYLDKKKTQEALHDGWYSTGDLGYKDDRGFYYLVSRKNNMIISGGENIFPLEIENCIREIGEPISDVVVLGVHSDIWGESVCAVVEKSKNKSLSKNDIANHCRKRLSPYKKPKEILITEELPRNASGKIDRNKTLEMILDTKGNS